MITEGQVRQLRSVARGTRSNVTGLGPVVSRKAARRRLIRASRCTGAVGVAATHALRDLGAGRFWL